jgi:hypothetical protein
VRKRDPHPTDIEQWDTIRHAGERDARTLLANAPADPLRYLAWRAGVAQVFPPDELDIIAAIDNAQHQRASWKEIVRAQGLPDEAVASETTRQSRRRKLVVGDGNDRGNTTPTS